MSKLDYILELGVEEIPAGYFGPAVGYLKERLTKELTRERLPFEKMEVWGGPRRLALGLWGLSSMQPDVTEDVTGPPISSAFDANGNPTKAAVGFAKGQGVPISEIFTINTAKGPYLAVRRSLTGKPSGEILSQVLPSILSSLPFPKVMRWGDGEWSFVRPVHWLLSVLGGETLPLSFCGVKAGKVSYGHRFLYPGAIVITSPSEYVERLSEAHVIVDFGVRRGAVVKEIERVMEESGAELIVSMDEELIDEVANLIEEPAAILGGFDSQFLDLPLAVSATAMKEHQRYFPITDNRGRQAPYFVAVNNTKARDMEVVRKGHERVLHARLDDARFYYLEDKKTKLSERAKDLRHVVFHHSLGSYQEKVERIKLLSLELAGELATEEKETILRAAELSKCDLVTGVVKEFPSLQGVMGREYALADGEPPEVAEALEGHYLPIRSGGDLPKTLPGAILSVADKLDTICGCFSVGLQPTGAADPFALRRQALGVLLIAIDRNWTGFSLDIYVDKAIHNLQSVAKVPAREAKLSVLEFFKARLKSHVLSQGISADGAEAVLSLDANHPPIALKKAVALEDIKKMEGFRDLAQTFKRVVNIIKKFGGKEIPLDQESKALLTKDAEKTLLQRVLALEEESSEYLKTGDFKTLLVKITDLRGPVDAFFEEVLVDDPDPLLKNARIALLNRTTELFELIADFSRISAI
jgi:glycyl-tRNA synthetase beta chain